MINIIRKNDEEFLVNVNDTSTQVLDMDELFKVLRSLQIEFDEIDLAVTELIRNDHIRAEFGMKRKFLYSK